MKDGRVILHSILSLSAVALQKVLDVEALWEISNTGEIQVKMNVKKDMEFPQLPRFGIRLFLKGEYEKARFYGKAKKYLQQQRQRHSLLTCLILPRRNCPGKHTISSWKDPEIPWYVWIMHRMELAPTAVDRN